MSWYDGFEPARDRLGDGAVRGRARGIHGAWTIHDGGCLCVACACADAVAPAAAPIRVAS